MTESAKAVEMTTKHTPGPWKATRQVERFDDSTLDRPYYSIELDTTKQPEGRRITGYVARVDGMRGERQEANARLIAKAPEMVEALAQLLAVIENAASHHPDELWLGSEYDGAKRLLAEIEGA